MSFLCFPPRHEILSRLDELTEEGEAAEELRRRLADRLSGRTYDSAAFTFIVMEVLFEFEESENRDLDHLLSSCVCALTGDRRLAASALEAFSQLKQSLHS